MYDHMRVGNLHVYSEKNSKGITVLQCPICGGTGSISCLPKGRGGKEKHDHVNPFCLLLPVQAEERCNCCDGKGGVNKGQSKFDFFCHLHKRSEK